MAETTLQENLQVIQEKLHAKLFEQKCNITSDRPNEIVAVQGSLWGTSAKSAKKKITFTLQQTSLGTKITAKSALTSRYLYFTATGCVLSVALALLCFWIGLDLTKYASTGEGYWGWLAYTGGKFSHFEPDIAAVYIRVTLILSAFLAGTLAAEALIVGKVRAGINTFAQEILNTL